MKILHLVEFYSPSKGGMQEVVKQLSEAMAKFGHEVIVGTTKLPERKETSINNVKVEGFSISGNEVYGFNADQAEITRFQNLVLDPTFDVVVLFAAQQWTCDLALPILEKIPGKKFFVPTGFSALSNKLFKNYFEEMKKHLFKFNKCVFLSHDYQDVNFAKISGLNDFVIIPNGASESEFSQTGAFDIKKKLGINEQDYLILHVGSHTNIKGHDEAISIFAKSKIKKSTLVLNGNVFSKRCYFKCLLKSKLINTFTSKTILLVDLPRPDVVALYKASDLFLFPSNLECSPIVLFEACASRTPFLVTDVGNSKEIAEWTHGGLILPTFRSKRKPLVYAETTKSAHILDRIYSDKELAKKLASDGYKAWKENFTWEKIARRYEELYNE